MKTGMSQVEGRGEREHILVKAGCAETVSSGLLELSMAAYEGGRGCGKDCPEKDNF